eukprot:TRINITY_DN5575_c0_g1_i1.p1 TRINITY_DN5575_c0_g1~~TRINITY_DN5575_c0_g1_i1.p1  ORF type:complete len:195 (+),score=35.30 TRINITY_DN5575_c0_g1_i1:36-620(+)
MFTNTPCSIQKTHQTLLIGTIILGVSLIICLILQWFVIQFFVVLTIAFPVYFHIRFWIRYFLGKHEKLFYPKEKYQKFETQSRAGLIIICIATAAIIFAFIFEDFVNGIGTLVCYLLLVAGSIIQTSAMGIMWVVAKPDIDAAIANGTGTVVPNTPKETDHPTVHITTEPVSTPVVVVQPVKPIPNHAPPAYVP